MANRGGGMVAGDRNFRPRQQPVQDNDVQTVIHAIKDDNLSLKRKLNEQDDKTKKLFTKIQRLTEELKRAKDIPGPRSGVASTRPDQETDDLINELRSQVSELQKSNSNLKGKAQYFKSLHDADSRKNGLFDHVSPRVNSGMQRRLVPALVVKSRPPPSSADYGAMVEEIEKLDDIVNMLREKEMHMEHEMDEMRAENRLLRESQDSNTMRGDVDRVALQRELTEKAKRIREWQTRYDQLEDKFRSTSDAHQESVRAMEDLNAQIKEERLRNAELERLHRKNEAAKGSEAELNEIINDLREEKKLLEQEQARMLQNALTSGRGDSVEVEALRKKILSLERELGEKLKENADWVNKYQLINEELKSTKNAGQDANVRMYDTQSRLEELEERLRWFSKNGEIDLADLEEALTMIRLKRERGLSLDFLMNLDELEDDKRMLQDLRTQYAQCIQELEKARRLLALQEEINRDYKNECEALNRRMQALKNEYELRLEEDARLLDLRANKLAYLEGQLKNLAHGTTNVHTSTGIEADDDVVLENGQNLVQIHVDGALISEEGWTTLRKLGLDYTDSTQAVFFVHFDFFNFETQVSPLGLGLRPQFNLSSGFKVFTDDFFLTYLKSHSMTMTLCRAVGVEFLPVASCSVSFQGLTDPGRTGRLQYYADLVSLHDGKSVIGKIDYSLRVHLPMSEVIKAFKERSFALNLLHSSDFQKAHVPAQAAVNHLVIRINNCSRLVPPSGSSPAVFVVCSLYGQQNVVTETIRSTTHPLFNFVKTVPIPVTHDVDRYLRTTNLEFLVLDENETHGDYVYGVAKIPLLGLAVNESIEGEFELLGQFVGDGAKIRVSIEWERPYRLDDPKVVSLFDARSTMAEIKQDVTPNSSSKGVTGSKSSLAHNNQGEPFNSVKSTTNHLKSSEIPIVKPQSVQTLEEVVSPIKSATPAHDRSPTFTTLPSSQLEKAASSHSTHHSVAHLSNSSHNYVAELVKPVVSEQQPKSLIDQPKEKSINRLDGRASSHERTPSPSTHISDTVQLASFDHPREASATNTKHSTTEIKHSSRNLDKLTSDSRESLRSRQALAAALPQVETLRQLHHHRPGSAHSLSESETTPTQRDVREDSELRTTESPIKSRMNRYDSESSTAESPITSRIDRQDSDLNTTESPMTSRMNRQDSEFSTTESPIKSRMNRQDSELSTTGTPIKARIIRQDSEYSTTSPVKAGDSRQSSIYRQGPHSADEALERNQFGGIDASESEYETDGQKSRPLYTASDAEGSEAAAPPYRNLARYKSESSSPSVSMSEGEAVGLQSQSQQRASLLSRYVSETDEEEEDPYPGMRTMDEDDDDDYDDETDDDDIEPVLKVNEQDDDEEDDNLSLEEGDQRNDTKSLPPLPKTSSKPTLITTPTPLENGVTISIGGIRFDTESEEAMELLKSVKQVFVGFEFLDAAPEELETHSVSMVFDKGIPRDVIFSFAKFFDMDAKKQAKDRSTLSKLIKSRNPYITFCVVSEPPENGTQDEECVDLATARLDLRDARREDMIETGLQLFNMEGDVQLGELVISVTGHSVLDELCM
ncbi:hypothetical protein SmJEL517_g05658 [Synchytrium microbalum]|uniref:C2 domain-containing protein n=1 Tax=Synchytrium microbalum TaxID=1806994 RepID=A0A507C030_9FUNG|nr:uncharacterized protein SmJEL517_g05658 [Synchytrium microbalum]TPX30883.1 hypothetical protein SmJEL517_g05658 [Synchytrium microbalum]